MMDPETSGIQRMTFSLLGPAAPVLGTRVGSLALASRHTISTPHYVPLTSRGAVSHIAHDVMRKETEINSLYMGLEDCKRSFFPNQVLATADLGTPSRAEISHWKKPTRPRIQHSHRRPAVTPKAIHICSR